MNKTIIQICVLNYGSTQYNVEANENLPIPREADFNDIENFAKKVLAIMSNASGGHVLRDCKVSYIKDTFMNITSSGCHVYYANKDTPKLKTAEDISARVSATQKLYLGDVSTDQYGDGWKRAVWSK